MFHVRLDWVVLGYVALFCVRLYEVWLDSLNLGWIFKVPLARGTGALDRQPRVCRPCPQHRPARDIGLGRDPLGCVGLC